MLALSQSTLLFTSKSRKLKLTVVMCARAIALRKSFPKTRTTFRSTSIFAAALARVAVSGLGAGATLDPDSRRPAARRTPQASRARSSRAGSSVAVRASGDGAAHSGIVEESVVHGSSLASVGISTRKKSVISEPPGTDARPLSERIGIQGVHHVAVIVHDLAASMEFYRDFLGLPVNPDRPNDKLPYDGAWLMMGPEMVHLMELPNPDPTDAEFRPAHGGKDRAVDGA